MAGFDPLSLIQSVGTGGASEATDPPPAPAPSPTPTVTDTPKSQNDSQPSLPPPDNTVPDFSKTPQGVENDRQIKATQDKVNAQIDAVKRAKESEQNSLKERDNALHAYQDQLRAINEAQHNPPELTPLNKMDHAQLNAVNQVKWQWPAMLALGLGIAGMVGKHHGLSRANQFFIGSFLGAYAKGAQEQQKQAAYNYWKSLEYEYKQNQERLQLYRENLSNAHFDLQTKMEMVKTYADLWKDQNVSRLAEQGLLTDLQKQLNNYQLANERYLSEAWKTFNAMHKLAKFPLKDEYEMFLQQDYAQTHGGHLPVSNNEWSEEMNKYPYTKWYEERKDIGGRDTEGKTRGFTPQPTPSASPMRNDSSTDTQKNIDSHVNDFLGNYGG